MSSLGITSYAEMPGAGGDICSDRLAPEWARHSGEKLADGDPVEAANVEQGFSEGVFPPKSELNETVEEAFGYVHKYCELKAGRGEKEWKSKRPGANERARDAADDLFRCARKIRAGANVVTWFFPTERAGEEVA
jgi:hypothetical protein